MGVFKRTSEDGTARALPYSAHRSLTAAAVRLSIADKSQVEQISRRKATNVWQTDAWDYYDLIGEIKYAFRLFANVLSRVRLVAGYIIDEDAPPVPIKDADLDYTTVRAIQKAMRRAFGATNQSNVLRKSTINLLVAGECYLAKFPAKYGVRDREEWKILSVDELVISNDKYWFRPSRSTQQKDYEEIGRVDAATTFVGRIWNEHARYSGEADSSMRALVDICDDLFLYTRAARASARSRLNAGALFVPDTLSVSAEMSTDFPEDLPTDPNIVPAAIDPEDDLFEQELIDAMTTPIADESSAASVVPLLIRGPREDGAAIRHIKFERTIDPQLSQRAERALERILQGIDLPKDIVTGLANIKYSNAVQIEESLYTAHIEPVVLLLCDAFRAVYLVPALEAAGIDPDVIENVVIWYDPSGIMTAPDKSNAANLGYDKMELSGEAWRRINGFAESDAPTPEELARRLALARGQLNDGLTEAILRTIMPEILDAARQQAIQNSPSPLPPGAQQLLDGAPPANPGGGLPPIVDGGGTTSDEPPPPPPLPGV